MSAIEAVEVLGNDESLCYPDSAATRGGGGFRITPTHSAWPTATQRTDGDLDCCNSNVAELILARLMAQCLLPGFVHLPR